MSAPNGESPPGSLAVGAFQAWQEQTQQDALDTMSGGVRSGMANARNVFSTELGAYTEVLDGLQDGQLALNDRVDLLEDVPGYASCYMDRNWVVPGAGRTLLFNAQLGPSKNATVVGNGAIEFEVAGLWRIDAHVSCYPAQSGWGSSPLAGQLYINVSKWDSGSGYAYSSRQFDIVVSTYGAETGAWSHTLVVPEGRTDHSVYFATVSFFHDKASHSVYGGTLRSALSVNRWGVGTDYAAVSATVPDGGTL